MDRILIVRTDRIGDVVLSLPVVSAVRSQFPDCEIGMLVQPAVVPLVIDHPGLNEVITDAESDKRFTGFFRFIQKIRKGGWDTVLLLHPTFRLAMALAFAGIPIRVGTAFRLYSLLFNRRVREHRKTSHRHEAEFNLSLACMIGVQNLSVEFNLPVQKNAEWSVHKWFEEIGISDKHPKIVLHAGSRGSARDWPADRFAQLADELIRKNEAVVLFTGADEERNLIESLVQNVTDPIYNLAGKFSLKELIAFLNQVDLFISNSTGPLHIAAALNTSVLGLYPNLRPASVRRWGPWGQIENCIVAHHAECVTCSARRCELDQCMQSISVEEVWQKANQILQSK